MASIPPQRLLFFGTPDFAVPSLEALAESSHAIVGVISQPDRPRGRGRKLEPTPVRAAADALQLPVLQPEKVGSDEALAWMRAKTPTLGIVVAFGQFLPRAVRELPPLGLINAHGSLLPRHRGAAPIQHAILAGDTVTGISVMRVVREMDAGPECLRIETPIGTDETAGELFERLGPLAGQALCRAVDQIASGDARFQEQDASQATFAPKLDRSFSQLQWSRPRAEILRRIRATTPWPGCSLELRRSARTFKLLRVRDGGPFAEASVRAGHVDIPEDRLRVAALDGWVEVLKLQPPGRRPMDAKEFLHGAAIQAGEEVK